MNMNSEKQRIVALGLLQKAFEEEERDNKKAAFKLYLKAAQLGDADAQNTVSVLYDAGDGVKKNDKRVMYWLKKSWRNKKQVGTCINLAITYERAGNRRRASYWWLKAADSGDHEAELGLAKFYLTSKRKSLVVKAKMLLKNVIGDSEATHDLAELYFAPKGRNVKKMAALFKSVRLSRNITEDSIEEALILLKKWM